MKNLFRYMTLIPIIFLMVGIFAFHVSAQEIVFAKKQVNIQPGILYFNVLQVKNTTSSAIEGLIDVELPGSSKLVGTIPSSVSVNPGEVSYIPIRFKPDVRLIADKKYIVKAIFNGGDVLKATTKLLIEPKHLVEVSPESKQLSFLPSENEMQISFFIENKGNVSELLEIDLELSGHLKLTNISSPSIVLGAGKKQKITIDVQVVRAFNKESFDNAYAKLYVKTKTDEKATVCRLSRLMSDYDHAKSTNQLPPHMVSLTSRITESNQKYSFNSRGEIAQQNGSYYYNLYIPDVTNLDLFLQSGLANFKYASTEKRMELGYGSSYTSLGDGLGKRNSVFAQKSFLLNDSSFVHSFANVNFFEKQTGIAVGYQKDFGNLTMVNSLYVNSEKEEKIAGLTNQSSLTTKIGRVSYRGTFRTIKRFDFNYNTYKHRTYYKGVFGDDKLTLDIKNDFLLVASNENYSIANNIYALGRYDLSNSRSLTTSYKLRKSSKYTGSSKNEFLSSNIASEVQLVSKNRFSLSTGLASQSLIASVDENSNKETNFEVSVRNAVKLFNFKSNTYLYYGSKSSESQFLFADYLIAKNYSSIAPYGGAEFFVNFQYKSGAFQSFSPLNYNEMYASAGYSQSFFGGALSFVSNANYYQSDRYNSNEFSVDAGIAYKTRGNLNINLKSTFRQNGNSSSPSFSKVEAGISKYFNVVSNKKTSSNLELVLFKDFNSNGVLDSNEEPISGVTVYLISQSSENNMHSINLVSGKDGVVRYKNLPHGSYKMKLVSMNDLGGFYNFDSKYSVVLNDDSKINIAYSKAGKIYGNLSVIKSQFSTIGTVDIANIRITAIDEKGREYSSLTDRFGNFSLYVPQNRTYTVTINNVFGGNLALDKNNVPVAFFNQQKSELNFVVKEKKRKINFGR